VEKGPGTNPGRGSVDRSNTQRNATKRNKVFGLFAVLPQLKQPNTTEMPHIASHPNSERPIDRQTKRTSSVWFPGRQHVPDDDDDDNDNDDRFWREVDNCLFWKEAQTLA